MHHFCHPLAAPNIATTLNNDGSMEKINLVTSSLLIDFGIPPSSPPQLRANRIDAMQTASMYTSLKTHNKSQNVL